MRGEQKVQTTTTRSFFVLVIGLTLLSFSFVMPVMAEEKDYEWYQWGEREDLGDGRFRYKGGAVGLGDHEAAYEWANAWAKDFGWDSKGDYLENGREILNWLTGGDLQSKWSHIDHRGFFSRDLDTYFVENGFRVTGLSKNDPHSSYDYTSFGVWAQDSFWGFWQGAEKEVSALTPWASPTRPTLFIAGGHNWTKPTIGTATWTGLAVGKHKLASEIRVGRSEVVVDFAASEVDVTIAGLVFGGVTAASVNGESQTFEAGQALVWKGLPLNDYGYFHEPRRYGVVNGLDDVFQTAIPVSGENYLDTADTIRGTFHGENGDEVVGVFSKNDIEGSFGAYRGGSR